MCQCPKNPDFTLNNAVGCVFDQTFFLFFRTISLPYLNFTICLEVLCHSFDRINLYLSTAIEGFGNLVNEHDKVIAVQKRQDSCHNKSTDFFYSQSKEFILKRTPFKRYCPQVRQHGFRYCITLSMHITKIVFFHLLYPILKQ